MLRRGNELFEITPEIMAFLQEPRPLIIAKANIQARVHRRVYLDYIGVKRFDAGGKLIGEHRIIGLFTSTAYTRGAHGIPYLRRKIAHVEQRAGFDPNSHSGKALANVLEHYPRDELFQVDEDTLYRFALAILHLDERPRVRVLARRDRFDRFVSVLVFVPRDRYDSDIRAKIGDYLTQRLHRARVGLQSVLPGRPAGAGTFHHRPFRRRNAGHSTRADWSARSPLIVRSWEDGLADTLALLYAPDKTRDLLARYRDAFTASFHEFYSPAVAASDIRIIEGLSDRSSARGRSGPSQRGRPAQREPARVEFRTAAAAVGARAGAGEHGLHGGGRAHLPHHAAGRRPGLVPRHAARRGTTAA